MILIYIALGGAIGAVLRFLFSRGIHSFLGANFPYGTLTVNVLGSFLIGLISIFLLDRMPLDNSLRAFLIIGFLGAFTTFSSFSFETLTLFENGAYFAAATNLLLNLSLCLIAVFVGVVIARQI